MNAISTHANAVYPERPVTIVVGFSAGSGTDTLARLIAKEMAESLDRAVIVENRPGAGSNMAAEQLAHGAHDAHTLYVATRPNTIHQAVYNQFRYDVQDDFEAIGLVATAANVIVARQDAPVRSIDDMVTFAKENPGDLTCATPPKGSTGDLLCKLFQQQTNTALLQVPYGNVTLAMTDLVGGRVDTVFVPLAVAMAYLQAGSARAIAVLSPQRPAALSETPTVAESGLPGLQVQTWFGLVAPKGTQPEVVEKLNSTLNEILSLPRVQELLLQRGYVPPAAPNSAASFEALLDEESKRWNALIAGELGAAIAQ